MNCEKTPVPGYTTDADKQPICHVSSQADGSFLFPTVPTGSYKLVISAEHLAAELLPFSFIHLKLELLMQFTAPNDEKC